MYTYDCSTGRPKKLEVPPIVLGGSMVSNEKPPMDCPGCKALVDVTHCAEATPKSSGASVPVQPAGEVKLVEACGRRSYAGIQPNQNVLIDVVPVLVSVNEYWNEPGASCLGAIVAAAVMEPRAGVCNPKREQSPIAAVIRFVFKQFSA